jgi:two-component system response regulator YesN
VPETPLEVLIRDLLLTELAFRLGVVWLLGRSRPRNVLDARSVNPAVTRTARFIEEHFAEHLTLNMISRGVHESSATLVRHYRAATGVTPHQYLSQVRFAGAVALLKDSDDKLDVIADSVGYKSRKHLHKECVRRTGLSPGRLRQWLSRA